MVRTQIQLTKEQATALKSLAVLRHESMAEVIRQGIDTLLCSISDISVEEKKHRAIAIAGRFRCKETDLSINHDKYLAEDYLK